MKDFFTELALEASSSVGEANDETNGPTLRQLEYSMSLTVEEYMHNISDLATINANEDEYITSITAEHLGASYEELTAEDGVSFLEKVKSGISRFIQKFLMFLSKWKNKLFAVQYATTPDISMLKALIDEGKYSSVKPSTEPIEDKVLTMIQAIAPTFDQNKVFGEIIFIDHIQDAMKSTMGNSRLVVNTIYDTAQKQVNALMETITDDSYVEVQKKIKEILQQSRKDMSSVNKVMDGCVALNQLINISGEDFKIALEPTDATNNEADDISDDTSSKELSSGDSDEANDGAVSVEAEIAEPVLDEEAKNLISASKLGPSEYVKTSRTTRYITKTKAVYEHIKLNMGNLELYDFNKGDDTYTIRRLTAEDMKLLKMHAIRTTFIKVIHEANEPKDFYQLHRVSDDEFMKYNVEARDFVKNNFLMWEDGKDWLMIHTQGPTKGAFPKVDDSVGATRIAIKKESRDNITFLKIYLEAFAKTDATFSKKGPNLSTKLKGRVTVTKEDFYAVKQDVERCPFLSQGVVVERDTVDTIWVEVTYGVDINTLESMKAPAHSLNEVTVFKWLADNGKNKDEIVTVRLPNKDIYWALSDYLHERTTCVKNITSTYVDVVMSKRYDNKLHLQQPDIAKITKKSYSESKIQPINNKVKNALKSVKAFIKAYRDISDMQYVSEAPIDLPPELHSIVKIHRNAQLQQVATISRELYIDKVRPEHFEDILSSKVVSFAVTSTTWSDLPKGIADTISSLYLYIETRNGVMYFRTNGVTLSIFQEKMALRAYRKYLTEVKVEPDVEESVSDADSGEVNSKTVETLELVKNTKLPKVPDSEKGSAIELRMISKQILKPYTNKVVYYDVTKSAIKAKTFKQVMPALSAVSHDGNKLYMKIKTLIEYSHFKVGDKKKVKLSYILDLVGKSDSEFDAVISSHPANFAFFIPMKSLSSKSRSYTEDVEKVYANFRVKKEGNFLVLQGKERE